MIGRYLGKSVLEVGAGIGSNLGHYIRHKPQYVTLVEPDIQLFSQLYEQCQLNSQNINLKPVNGNISHIEKGNQLFDSILYIDVLEHIKDDTTELFKASKLLKTNGYIIVLSPAHNFLYSPFDKSVGHYRRYCKKTMINATPSTLKLQELFYLDSVGLILSLANKLRLTSPIPTLKQINFWDSRIIPISRILDKVFGYRVGKTIIGIYQKSSSETIA